MHVSVLSNDELEALECAIEIVLDEATERGMSLSLSDATARLFEAFMLGERDPDRLAEAVLFDGGRHRIH